MPIDRRLSVCSRPCDSWSRCRHGNSATLFSAFPLEQAVIVVDEIAEQLHADLAKRDRAQDADPPRLQ